MFVEKQDARRKELILFYISQKRQVFGFLLSGIVGSSVFNIVSNWQSFNWENKLVFLFLAHKLIVGKINEPDVTYSSYFLFSCDDNL